MKKKTFKSKKPFGKPLRPKLIEKSEEKPFKKESRSFGKSVGKSFTKSGEKPFKKESKPFERPEGRSYSKPKGKPNNNPTGKRFGKPFGKESESPFKKHTGNSFGKSRGRSFGKPTGKFFDKRYSVSDTPTVFTYYVVNKPYEVLSQFTPEHGKKTLKDLFNFPKDVYPVGRLDADSEGLLILTNDKSLNNSLLNPENKHQRTYLAQVEGKVTEEAIKQLEEGVTITISGKGYKTLPAKAKIVPQPKNLQERNPPIRFRKEIPTSFITITLTEGKNRQVRKMTAAVGFPTLRLIRTAIENLKLENMRSGEVAEMERETFYKQLKFT
jgi:23S rRNA pseudouridine2457 synthase